MIESEIVAAGSVEGVFSGKSYNRCVRAHKIVFEALHRLRLMAFYNTLKENEAESMNTFGVKLLNSYNDASCNDADGLMQDGALGVWKYRYDSFVKECSEKNPTFAFWSTYMQMVQLLLEFIRATRTSDWQLHLSTLRSMIP